MVTFVKRPKTYTAPARPAISQLPMLGWRTERTAMIWITIKGEGTPW